MHLLATQSEKLTATSSNINEQANTSYKGFQIKQNYYDFETTRSREAGKVLGVVADVIRKLSLHTHA